MAKGKSAQVTWAQAVRDIVIAAINKGQLIPLGILAILLLVVWKLPQEEVLTFGREIVGMLKQGELVSYPICFALGFGWFFHSRSLRKKFSTEYERIGNQKTDLQSIAAGIRFQSSN